MSHKPTKAEIDLARQLHELGVRKELKDGDWLCLDAPGFRVGTKLIPDCDEYQIHPDTGWLVIKRAEMDKVVDSGHWWLCWQIHDCLEWLRGKGLNCFHIDYQEGEINLQVQNIKDGNYMQVYAKTPLAALQKAMIAIAEEGK